MEYFSAIGTGVKVNDPDQVIISAETTGISFHQSSGSRHFLNRLYLLPTHSISKYCDILWKPVCEQLRHSFRS
jgi:hypothetical protein